MNSSSKKQVFNLAKATGILLLLFFTLLPFIASAQSFYYFEAKPVSSTTKAPSYFIFLTVAADGTSQCRVRYINAITGEQCLVQQKLKDSSDITMILAPAGAKKYLLPLGDADFIEGLPDENFMQPRFVFEKQVDNNGSYYTAKAIEYTTANGQWLTATLTTNEQKNYQQLIDDKNFVRYFYQENDDFYTYLTKLNTRGGLNEQQLKTKFYLIAVTNTNDAKIGPSSKKDLDKITEYFYEVTYKLGITLIQKTIWGVNFNKTNVQKAVDEIQPTPNDIVMFYYSGHGFRYASDNSKFPRMSLRTSKLEKLDDNNLGVESIYKILLSKGAKVTLVLSDCCNNEIEEPMRFGLDLLRPRATGNAGLKINYENCIALFFPKQPVSILVGSAEKYQFASGNPDLGGFFTNFFLAELSNTLYSNKGASWLKILVTARESTTKQALTAACDNTANGRCTQRAELQVIPPL
jgi:Caspase domain